MRQLQEKRMRRLLLAGVWGLVGLAISATTALSAVEPSITFNPSSWDYGVVTPSTTVSKTFVLTNGKKATGTLAVGISGSSTFSITADSCSGAKLAANKGCSVTVQFAPTAAGTHETASVLAVSNKPLLNASITLVGGVSEGCATVNDPAFGDGFYISAGVNLPFKAGETVTAHSEEPVTGTTPTQIIIENSSNTFATAAWPGTAQYTLVAAETSIFWTTDTNAQTTWTVSCAG